MSFVRVPPDSTGKKVYTKEATIGLDVVQTQVIHLADENNPANLLAVDAQGSASVRFAEGQPIMSGFGNLKVAQQRALGVYESSMDTYNDLFAVEEVSGGTSVYQTQASSHVLSVTGAINSRVTRTTNRYHYYLPGTSNVVNMTIACGDLGKPGNVRRWGAFDDNDGVFFELNGQTLNVVMRSSTDGTIQETRVAKENWNFDILDGTGISGHNLNILGINVWWLDYQWLGAGRVRFGIFAEDGARLICHQFENAGQFSLPYMRTGTLPLRTENVNTSTVGAASELREVCMAMYTEGTYEDYTFWRHADIERYAVTVTGIGTHLISLRSKTTINGKHNHVQAFPENLSIYTDQPIAISLWDNTVLTSGTWSIVGSGSLNGSIDGTLDTSGAHKFQEWYLNPGSHNIDLTKYFEVNDEGILCRADGVPVIWSFAAKKLGATDATVSINVGYRELW